VAAFLFFKMSLLEFTTAVKNFVTAVELKLVTAATFCTPFIYFFLFKEFFIPTQMREKIKVIERGKK